MYIYIRFRHARLPNPQRCNPRRIERFPTLPPCKQFISLSLLYGKDYELAGISQPSVQHQTSSFPTLANHDPPQTSYRYPFHKYYLLLLLLPRRLDVPVCYNRYGILYDVKKVGGFCSGGNWARQWGHEYNAKRGTFIGQGWWQLELVRMHGPRSPGIKTHAQLFTRLY